MSSTEPGPEFSVRFAEQTSDLSGYEELTYPLFSSLLQRVGTDPAIHAVLASHEGAPAGLTLAEITSPENVCVLRSIYVESPFRKRGCALAMLDLMEQRVREAGASRFTGTYAKNAAVDALLVRSGWKMPEPSMYLFHVPKSGMEALHHAPFFRETQLGAGQEIVPWGKLTPSDHATIDEAVIRFQVPKGLTSATEPSLIDPELSLALRIDGTIYVWLLVHRTGPERRRYTGLYARPDCPVKGLAIRLVFESVRKRLRQMEGLFEADATWGCIASMPMAGFCLRRLVPSLPGIRVTETFLSEKALRAE